MILEMCSIVLCLRPSSNWKNLSIGTWYIEKAIKLQVYHYVSFRMKNTKTYYNKSLK